MDDLFATMVKPGFILQKPADQIHARINDVRVQADCILVALEDGRIIQAPLSWFPVLQSSEPDQRGGWMIGVDRNLIIWPEIGESISLQEVLAGASPCERCWFRVSYYK